MNYLLLICAVALGVTKNLVSRRGSRVLSGTSNLFRANLFTAGIALLLFGFGDVRFEEMRSPVFILLAVGYALATMASQMLYIQAVRRGPVSVCTMIYYSGFLLPTFFSTIVYHEPLSAIQGAGVLILLSALALVNRKEKSGAEKGYGWLPVAAGSMLASGSIGILQKIFRTRMSECSMDGYLFLAFGFMLLISLFFYAILPGKDRSGGKERFLWPLALGLSMVLVNRLNLYLSGVLPGILFFPGVNAGNIMVTAIFSHFLLGEEMTPKRWTGVALAVIAIALIAL